MTAKKAATKKSASKQRATAGKKASRPTTRAAKTTKRTAPAGKKAPSKPAKAAGPRKGRSGAKTAAKRERVKFSKKELNEFRAVLLAMRERLTGQIQALRVDALTREDSVNSEEDGTDAFERQFALDLARSENEAVFEIDEALRRISEETYGICEDCSCLIEKARLAALPFTRLCIECKSAQETGKAPSAARALMGLR